MFSPLQLGSDEKGFTLVEILVALLILGLVLVAILPLLAMANKIIYSNRDMLIANQIAKTEIETISSQITPQNYNELSGPLVPGVNTKYMDHSFNEVEEEEAVYTVVVAVGWVDDANDGLSPADPIPFDYKYLQVSVSAPSIFTGVVTERADFSTYRAREGAADPISGVLVQVERAWRSDPDVSPPVDGVQVTVTDDGGTTYTSLTDELGRALIQLNPTNTDEASDYTITASKNGMILNPEYSDGKVQSINRYSTQMVVLQMDYPVSITVDIDGRHQGGLAVLSGGNLLPSGQPLQVTLDPGDDQVSFDNLWPVGTSGNISGSYSVDIADLIIYENNYTDLNDFVRWEENDSIDNLYNLWLFDSYAGKWLGQPEDSGSYTTYSRLGLTIHDINQFKPAGGFQIKQSEGSDMFYFCAADFTIDEGEEDLEYILIHKSNADAPLTDILPVQVGWEDVTSLDDAVNAAADGRDILESTLSAADLEYDTLNLRFDTTPSIKDFEFGTLSMKATYTNSNITFSSEGQDLVLSLFATP